MAVAVGVSLLVASCTGGAHPTNPYAVPSKITPAYVQRVLNALEGVNARATRLIVENHRLVPEAQEILKAIDAPNEYPLQEKIWNNDIQGGLANYRTNPGVVRDRLLHVISAGPGCIYAAIVRDYREVDINPPQTHTSYIGLKRTLHNTGIIVNPTPWSIAFLGYTTTGAQPPDPC
jgi:hypothetical protein